jgi:hypothetical protein
MLLLGLLAVCMLSLPAKLRADDAAPPEVRAAAESGLPEFLYALPEDALPLYGFGGRELSQARLGHPYRVHILSPEDLITATAQRTLAPHLTATELWVFPVLVGDQSRTLLWVDLMPDGYRAVQLGNTVLAKSLSVWNNRLPQLLSEKGIGAYRARLVQIPQLLTDVLLLTSRKDEYIVPLHAPPDLSNAFRSDALSRSGDALPILQARLSSRSSEPSGGLAPAGGSAAPDLPGHRPWLAATALAVLVAALLGQWWHQRRARHEGTK